MTAGKYEVMGMDEVMEALHNKLSEIKGKTARGMIEAAIIIRRDMEDSPPKVPVDTGNLRASLFTVVYDGKTTSTPNIGKQQTEFKGEEASNMSADHEKTKSAAATALRRSGEASLAIGFSAHYAWRVHEMTGADFTSPRMRRGKEVTPDPGAGAKFLQSAIYNNMDKIFNVIAKNAKI